jgi:hypothetical protein
MKLLGGKEEYHTAAGHLYSISKLGQFELAAGAETEDSRVEMA